MRPDTFIGSVLLMSLLMIGDYGFAQETLRDPTRPYTAPVLLDASPVRFAVNAIVNSDKRRLAIVNGRRVAVGDEIGGAVVMAIGAGEVVLAIDGEEITLTLNRGARQR